MSRYKLRLRFLRWIFSTAYRLAQPPESKTILLLIKQALDREIKS